jgi:TolB-like protein
VFSGAANHSAEIKKELSLGSRYRVPLIAFRIEEVEPGDAFAYELSTSQWIDGFDDWDKSLDVLGRSLQQMSGGEARGAALERAAAPAGTTKFRRWAAAGAAAAAVASVAGYAIVERARDQNAMSMPTVAVLPFTASSGDPATRALASAARDSVAHTLSKTAFPVSTAGTALHDGRPVADFLITGDLSNNSGKFIATVRVEETVHHVIVLSRRFEANQAQSATLADRIGAQVAGTFGWTAPMLMIERRHPSDPAITAQLFEQASVDNVNALHGYETARRLAAKAPDSALAQTVLAFNAPFAMGELPRDQRAEALAIGRRAAERIVALAPESGGSYIPWCLVHSSVRMIECEDRLRAGMRIDPDAPFNDFFLSQLLLEGGRFDEAVELARHSLAHDQYVPLKIARAMRLLDATGDAGAADKLYRQGREWWPEMSDLIWHRMSGMMIRGDFAALERFQSGLGPDDFPLADRLPKDLAAALRARNAAAAAKACPGTITAPLRALYCMLGLSQLGDGGGAVAFADQLYPRLLGRTPAEEDQLWLSSSGQMPTFFLSSPATAAMRRDPRFLAVAERIGLLRYWRSGRPPDFCRDHPEPICPRLLRRS